jgi:hypothetical protein
MEAEDHVPVASIDRDFELVPPTGWLRWFYAATFPTMVLFGTILHFGEFGVYLAMHVWPLLLWAIALIAVPVLLWRPYLVWQHPLTLTRVRTRGLSTLLWSVAITMIVIGWIPILGWFVISLGPFGALRVGMDASMNVINELQRVIGIGFSGLLLLEWTRLTGFESAYRRTATADVPEKEPEPVVWLNVVALAMLLMLLGTQIVELVDYTATQAGRPWSWYSTSDGRFHLGPSSSSLLGLILALPTALLVAARIVTLVRHRKGIPLPKSTGALRAVRRIAVAGLVVYVLAFTARLIGEMLGDASGMIGKAVPSYVPDLIMLLGPVFLVALEGSRLLAYELLAESELE